MFIPSILVSMIIIKYVNLEKLKKSFFGKDIQRFLTTSMEIVRFLGFAMMILGAWLHFIWLILCGLIIILIGLFRGIVDVKRGGI